MPWYCFLYELKTSISDSFHMGLTNFLLSNLDTDKDRHRMEQKCQVIEQLQEMGFDDCLIREAIAQTKSFEIHILVEYLGKYRIRDLEIIVLIIKPERYILDIEHTNFFVIINFRFCKRSTKSNQASN